MRLQLFFLPSFNGRCVNSALWGRGQGRRRGAGGAYRRPCPVLPSAHCGGRSVNLNAAVSASPGRRLLPVLSVCPPWSTCSGAHLCIPRLSSSCLGPRTVPNAERSTRCPGANLEADRSTWVQFKVSRAEPRCEAIFDRRGRLWLCVRVKLAL